jgi:hypothetical protein
MKKSSAHGAMANDGAMKHGKATKAHADKMKHGDAMMSAGH